MISVREALASIAKRRVTPRLSSFHKSAAKMAEKRIYFRVHGTVQGVNFRNFTSTHANDYGLVGFVRNTIDGKVEGEAQGNDESLQKLLKDVDRGPRLAHVVKVEKQEIEPKEGEDNFVVRR